MSCNINIDKINKLSYDNLKRFTFSRKDYAYSILVETEKRIGIILAKKRRKSASPSKSKIHERIKKREKEIINSGNVVNYSERQKIEVMEKYNITSYRIELWGDIRLKANYSYWLIKFEEDIVVLWHESDQISNVGNDRSSYHKQNVF